MSDEYEASQEDLPIYQEIAQSKAFKKTIADY